MCLLVCKGEVVELFSLVANEDCFEVVFVELVIKENYVWYLVIVIIFMGFGQSRTKRCERYFKVINWGGNASHSKRRFLFIGKRGFPLCNIAVLWNFIVSHTGHYKRFHRIPLFTILLLFYLFGIYSDWQDQKVQFKLS